VRVEQAAVVDEPGDAVVPDPGGQRCIAYRGRWVELALNSVVVPPRHDPRQHGRQFGTEPVFEVAVLPAQARRVKRDDEQPRPQCGVVGRDPGEVVRDEQRQMRPVASMKSWRSSRAPTVSPTIRRLTSATRGADRCQSRGT